VLSSRRTRSAGRLAVVTAALAIAPLAPHHAQDRDVAPRAPIPEGLRGVPDLPEDLPEGWYARLDTDRGTIVVRLLPDQAPQSVAHFAALAEGRLSWTDPLTGQEAAGHYYDGILIHKALAGERFEAGDRTATGRGAPPYYVPPEGFGPVNFAGPWRMGMTRFPGGAISGVVFFVSVASQPSLNGKHPCFGEIVAGKEVVWDITLAETTSHDTPREPIVIDKVRVHAVGHPDALPEPSPYVPTRPKPTPRPQPLAP
jgi:peptidyl-prolyl cis-trans isomerase A (cyclophilin A)